MREVQGGSRWGSLGGRRWRIRWFELPIFTAFTGLSFQNHFLGDAGHLTVGHCVGSVPATQTKVTHKKIELNCSWLTQIWLYSYIMTLTFEIQIHSACRAGSVLQRKRKSTSGQNLALEVLQKTWKYLDRSLVIWCRETSLFHTIKTKHCSFLYLGGVEWPLLCTQHCHRSCCWSWTRGALE